METAMDQKESASLTGSFQLNRIVLLAAAGLILRAFFIHEPPLVPLRVGDPIPEFRLELFDGNYMDPRKVVGASHVFFFYANWCPCANYSAPFLKRAFEDYVGKGISFVAVGFQDSREDPRSFAERHRLPFPAGSDAKDATSRAFGIGTPPTTVFVNSQGKVSSILVGKIKNYGELTEHIEKIMD